MVDEISYVVKAPRKQEYKIEYIGQPAKIVLRGLTVGEKCDIVSASTKTRATSAISASAEVDVGKVRLLTIIKGIKEAPFTINEETVREFDDEFGDWLFDQINNLTSVSDAKKRGLNTQSNTGVANLELPNLSPII